MVPLKQKISGSDQNAFNARVVKQLMVRVNLEPMVGYKLCNIDRTVNLESINLYYRAASLLKYLLQNPRGVKHLRYVYSKVRKSDSVKPPKRSLAGGYVLNQILKELKKKQLIASTAKGLYTAREGRNILKKCL